MALSNYPDYSGYSAYPPKPPGAQESKEPWGPAHSLQASLPEYAELHCLSNFSFLQGASHAQELVSRAQALGYGAIAITDECSLAGVVRAHLTAKEQGVKLLIGASFVVQPGAVAITEAAEATEAGLEEARTQQITRAETAPFKLIALACDRKGYGNLSEFITAARRRAVKGEYSLTVEDFEGREKGEEGCLEGCLEACVALLIPARGASFETLLTQAQWFASRFGGRGWIAVELLHALDDALWLHQLRQLSEITGLPLVAAGDVHMHVRSRKPLQDALTAIRLNLPISECGEALQSNAERHLRSRLRLAQLYPADLLAETIEVAARCSFNLDELRYEYPDEVVPEGETASNYLRRMSYEGASHRFPQGIPASVQGQIEHELALIAELGYEKYFLTVYDLVRFAKSRHILCQGRGSAANSAVCYCLGITEVDPARMSTLFERFISKERNEPPDIDVDFEHQRREEVMQYLYNKYGRDRAALTATVVSYRPRSALRDMAKVLGIEERIAATFAKYHHGFSRSLEPERLAQEGIDLHDPRILMWLKLSKELIGFPRHLSQHTGGFVIAKGLLSRLVPIENAAMPDRSVIQWDKDDIDALGLMKVDVLALGMLSAIRRCLDLASQLRGYEFSLQDIPAEDHATYDMICKADTVGVFQIESRAQQSMLPRLQPRCFYDLVIEVAIVRPGPIQGGMVHPYLRRRQGLEAVSFPNEDLRTALGRTLGVPIFQEQVMQVAMLAAGFTAGEADSLRRAMAAWKRKGGVDMFYDRIINGMTSRGYERSFAEALFKQIEGFGEYGFPESHAASFALLVYASSWLKRHEPACFLASLLNSQPMGFYSPSQLVQDARRHGVAVLPVDVMHSEWGCSLEGLADRPLELRESSAHHVPHAHPVHPTHPSVRLGLCQVAKLSQAAVERLIAARQLKPFMSIEDLAHRASLDTGALKALAAADALNSLAGHRRQQVWESSAIKASPLPSRFAGAAKSGGTAPLSANLLSGIPIHETDIHLPLAPEGEAVLFDYAATGLTLRTHPMALLRPQLAKRGLLSSGQMHHFPDGRLVRTCGIVITRQQPQTAKGTVFVTLEDEDGSINVIVWRSLKEKQRKELTQSRLMAVYGQWQRAGEVRHLVAQRLVDLSAYLGRLPTLSRDFR